MKHVSKKRLSSYLLFSILTTPSAYGMWDKLQQVVKTSQQYDLAKTSTGIVVIGSLAYYAYLLRNEFWVQESQTKAYLDYINGTCLYIIDKKSKGVTITQPWPETRSLEAQYQQTLALANYFQKQAKTLKKQLASTADSNE